MHLQQMELDAMRAWLDDMEQRMVDAEAISDQADKVQEQTALHRVRQFIYVVTLMVSLTNFELSGFTRTH
jgi:hypothetical protein